MTADGGLTLARDLLDHEIPVVAVNPSPRRNRELEQPIGWSTMTADDAREQLASSYVAGTSVLALVTGHGLDVLDVDTKAPTRGSVANLPNGIETFGEHATPGAGTHLFVRSTGYATLHGWGTSAGPIGDYLGGAPGGGRGLCYLAGPRPKYRGGTYRVITEIDIDRALEAEPDPELITTLRNTGGRTRAEAGNRAVGRGAVLALRETHRPTEDRIPCNYGLTALQKMLDTAPTEPGSGRTGRHVWCVRSMVRAVELIQTDCLTPTALDAIAAKLRAVKPDGDTDPDLVEAWAWANAKHGTACGLHKPGGFLERKAAARA